MATEQYNIPLGGEIASDITQATGSAISSGAVQVTIDLAVVSNKRQVILALKSLENYLKSQDYPG